MTREQWRRYVELFGDWGLLAELERLWAIEDAARAAQVAWREVEREAERW